MRILGVDPGKNGALAVYDSETGRIAWAVDMPSYEITTRSGRKRGRLHEDELIELIILASNMGVDRAVVEEVHALPKQSTSGNFTFGYICGSIAMAVRSLGLRIEPARPAVWKRAMRIPTDAEGILARANDIFPHERGKWRGPRGRIFHDRIEAAMLAKYGADYIKW
jgi:hypothetical protein